LASEAFLGAQRINAHPFLEISPHHRPPHLAPPTGRGTVCDVSRLTSPFFLPDGGRLHPSRFECRPCRSRGAAFSSSLHAQDSSLNRPLIMPEAHLPQDFIGFRHLRLVRKAFDVYLVYLYFSITCSCSEVARVSATERMPVSCLVCTCALVPAADNLGVTTVPPHSGGVSMDWELGFRCVPQ
jgi:hypothetical protein